MRIHSDIISPMHVINAVQTAKQRGHIGHEVNIDTISAHGSRKRAKAVEFTLGCSTSESFISESVAKYAEDYGSPRSIVNKIKRRYPRRGKSQFAGDTLATSPTWHEWGHVIAELFAIDPKAIVGTYDEADSFYYQTYEQPVNYGHFDPMTDEGMNGRAYDFLADIEDWEERTDNYCYWG